MTASRWCHRWHDGQQTWAYADPSGAFDARRYQVRPVSADVAAGFCAQHHYLHSRPASTKHRYGLFHHGHLLGVAVYGIPPTDRVLLGPLPDLEPYRQSVTLSRLVIAPTPGNTETWFLARCRRFLLDAGVRAFVTYADPAYGHCGIIYQAFNSVYLGTTAATTTLWLPDGTCLDGRTVQKIRAQEPGHAAAERRLVAHGARPIRAGQKPHAWLREALTDAHVTRRRSPGKHRYAVPLDRRVRVYTTGRDGQRIRIEQNPSAYPKPPLDLFTASGVTL